MVHYLLLFGLIMLIDLIPAFGPPAWIAAVFFYHKYHLAFLLVVLISAIATTLGRLLLAKLTRALRNHLPKRLVDNLDFASAELKKRRRSARVLIGLFILSPLPSAQLFEAAGLMETLLLPLGLAFFVGRLISLSIYLSASKAVVGIHRVWEAGFGSPLAIAAEVIAILGLVALLNLRWIITKTKSH